MIHQKLIDEIIKRLVQVYNPLEIYLFESEHWTEDEEPDDIDLKIIVESFPEGTAPMERGIAGTEALCGLAEEVFMLVFTKNEFDEMRLIKDLTFLHTQKYGLKIYAKQ